jgi:hypothetical protein
MRDLKVQHVVDPSIDLHALYESIDTDRDGTLRRGEIDRAFSKMGIRFAIPPPPLIAPTCTPPPTSPPRQVAAPNLRPNSPHRGNHRLSPREISTAYTIIDADGSGEVGANHASFEIP